MSTEADKTDQEIAREAAVEYYRNDAFSDRQRNHLGNVILAAMKQAATSKETYAEKAEHANDTFVMADIIRLRDENKVLVARLKLFERGNEVVNELLEKAGLPKSVDYGFLKGGRHFGINQRVSALVAQLAEAEKAFGEEVQGHLSEVTKVQELIAACKEKDEALKVGRSCIPITWLNAHRTIFNALAIQPYSSDVVMDEKTKILGEKDA